MATRLSKELIDQALALGLFEGDAAYYYPDGAASSSERDHLIEVILRAAIERLESK